MYLDKIKLSILAIYIKGNGVATDLVKIKAIVEWPEPKTVTQLRSFLGLTSYYRRFIQGYGVICKPLFEALKKNSFVWGDKQKKAFARLKTIMTTAPVLALPDYTQDFCIGGRCK